MFLKVKQFIFYNFLNLHVYGGFKRSKTIFCYKIKFENISKYKIGIKVANPNLDKKYSDQLPDNIFD